MDGLTWLVIALAILLLVLVLFVLLRRSRRQGTILAAGHGKDRRR